MTTSTRLSLDLSDRLRIAIPDTFPPLTILGPINQPLLISLSQSLHVFYAFCIPLEEQLKEDIHV